jgi:2-oxoisovalerate dehydrogenase E1 component
MNRAEVVDRNFVAFCKNAPAQAAARSLDELVADDVPELTGRALRELFESQIVSRLLDLAARELRKVNRGYYTIGSSGHEGLAAVGRATRYHDPAFLHYRDGALLAERSRQAPGENFIRNTILSFMASSLDPISGGRHKVWGSVPMCVLPQTSTIASHPPKAVGAALALERARKIGTTPKCGAFGELPEDSIVVCSFGDASVNHSVAQGAFNTASYATFQNVPVPILFVCEDNGIGISVRTARGWIETSMAERPGIRYFACDGLDLVDAYRGAKAAADYVRASRKPAFLHMRVVRLLGHAGTDPETEYHSLAHIEADEARDPLLAGARGMIAEGFMSAAEILDLYESTRARIRSVCDELRDAPQLKSAAEVVAALAPYDAAKVNAEAARAAPADARLHAFALDTTPGFLKTSDKPRLPENQPPRHMAVLINWALRDLMAANRDMLIFGEDVAARGGVYYVTAGISARYGPARVFNTLLDETSILGTAIGAGHLGMLPFPEIQYLAYVHNAIDQLRGEACSAQFFSKGQFPNPMVVRVQALGYQKGFGGHFHNDNSIAALRDIPSLIVAVPCRGDDAAMMLRTCAALARAQGRVCAFLEPIALYMTKDLYADGDGQWLCAYPPPGRAIPLGEGRVYRADDLAGSAEDLTILTFGNGVPMSLRAARELREKHAASARVVDLRWLSPLNEAFILEQSRATGRVLVVDEGRYSGGVSEAILALIHQHTNPGEVRAKRLTGLDTYIPLGPAANEVLPTERSIVAAAASLLDAKSAPRKRPARV